MDRAKRLEQIRNLPDISMDYSCNLEVMNDVVTFMKMKPLTTVFDDCVKYKHNKARAKNAIIKRIIFHFWSIIIDQAIHQDKIFVFPGERQQFAFGFIDTVAPKFRKNLGISQYPWLYLMSKNIWEKYSIFPNDYVKMLIRKRIKKGLTMRYLKSIR